VMSQYFDDQITAPSGNATAWTKAKGGQGIDPFFQGETTSYPQ
jgi:hypothetical protein